MCIQSAFPLARWQERFHSAPVPAPATRRGSQTFLARGVVARSAAAGNGNSVPRLGASATIPTSAAAR